MKRKLSILLLVLPLLILMLVANLAAAAGNPPTAFTHNTLSTGANTTITGMEQTLLDQIAAAQLTIDAAIYDFNRISIRDALIAAHNRGVAVRVVTDDDAYNNGGYFTHFSALQSAGIPVINDGRSSIMHNKFLIFDGQVVWTGSTNITDNGLTFNHNNSIILTSNELADIYTIEFEEMFVGRRFGTAKSDNVTHTVSYNGIPLEIYFSPSDSAMDRVLDRVNAAQSDIHFGIFFFTDDPLREALLARMDAGVTVTGVWDQLGAANSYSEDEVLCDAGAFIKRENFGGKLHNKFMIIDGEGAEPVLITGSMNWTGAGGDANDENTLIIYDGDTALAYLAAFHELWEALDPSTACNLPLPPPSSWVYLPMVLKPGVPVTQQADVRISFIMYNPAGSDAAGEYVTLRNQGAAAAELGGWKLHDVANTSYTFPSFTLPPNASVNVWVKAGADSAADLYWGRGSAVWNNSGDTATLQDGSGALVDACSYTGGGVSASCD